MSTGICLWKLWNVECWRSHGGRHGGYRCRWHLLRALPSLEQEEIDGRPNRHETNDTVHCKPVSPGAVGAEASEPAGLQEEEQSGGNGQRREDAELDGEPAGGRGDVMVAPPPGNSERHDCEA